MQFMSQDQGSELTAMNQFCQPACQSSCRGGCTHFATSAIGTAAAARRARSGSLLRKCEDWVWAHKLAVCSHEFSQTCGVHGTKQTMSHKLLIFRLQQLPSSPSHFPPKIRLINREMLAILGPRQSPCLATCHFSLPTVSIALWPCASHVRFPDLFRRLPGV